VPNATEFFHKAQESAPILHRDDAVAATDVFKLNTSGENPQNASPRSRRNRI